MSAHPTKPVDLATVLAGAHLPALPQSAVRLLELSQDPNNGPAEFAVPIEADPALAGQVLRFVNSSYFGFSRTISSVKLAISLVGVRTIKNFVLWSAIYSLMPNPRCGRLEVQSLWVDSLRRALLARRLGQALQLSELEELFCSALLQDMSIPLLARELSREYAELLELREQGPRRLSDLERERFGWTHADASASLARHWRLPERLAELMEQHTFLERLREGTLDKSAACVACSALLPSAAEEQWVEQESFAEAYQQLTGSPPASIPELFATIDHDYSEFLAVLKLAPAPPLATRFSPAPVSA